MTCCFGVLCRCGTQWTDFDHINDLTRWYKDSAFLINEDKAKKLVVVSHQNARHDLPPVLIYDQPVEAVEEFKYSQQHLIHF